MCFHTGTRASRPPAHFALPENGSPHTSALFPLLQPSVNVIVYRDRLALHDGREQSLDRGLRGRAFRNIRLPEKAMSAKPAVRIARLRAVRRKTKLPDGSAQSGAQEFLERLCQATPPKQKQTAPRKSIRPWYISRSPTTPPRP